MRALKILGLLFCFFLSGFDGQSQTLEQPKLVVGIVVDQMRYDYLYRFYNFYEDDGFKRLMSSGMNFTFAHYNYVPTYTGPGHSSIYTGSTPYYHGIISNNWYDKENKKVVYCAGDPAYETVGADNTSGQMSPHYLLTSTITDELRMSNNGLSRVYATSLKDRASVLPGGHMANAAYWYDGKSGNFISSTYYLEKLPKWVSSFNGQELPKKLMKDGWPLAKDLDAYEIAQPDAGAGEGDPFAEGSTTFPHSFKNLTPDELNEVIRTTPFGNELLTNFSLDLLRNENLGKGRYPDFLAISYSSPDYVGHAFGPNSMEIMDTYIRLDREIARLLQNLDQEMGEGNYLLFLTADHGVKANAAYLEENRMPNGVLRPATVRDSLRSFCTKHFGSPMLIETVDDNQIYYNHDIMQIMGKDVRTVDAALVHYLRQTFSQMGAIHTKSEFNGRTAERNMNNMILNGFQLYRSGDLCFELNSGHITANYAKGTTHGASYDYDTHVPLLFFGWGVPVGESNEQVYIEDIAPTLSNMLHIPEPDGCIGIPLIQSTR
ncbi:MAG: alkaline phosphatase family protein [Bacteroidia bacterium]|nr:alkaline phosphatase family protein [Bacteroidia bacterium]